MADLQVEDKKSKKIKAKVSYSNGGGVVVVGGALVLGAILMGFMNRRSKERRRSNNKRVEDSSKVISENTNCNKEEDMQGLRSLLLPPSPSKNCSEEESKICSMNLEGLILGEGFVSKIDGKEEKFTCINLEIDSDSSKTTLSAGDDCEINEDIVLADLAGFSFNSPHQECIEVVDDIVALTDSTLVKKEVVEESDVTHVGEGTVEENPSIQIVEEEEEEEFEEQEEEEESVEEKGEEGSDGTEISSTESNPEAIWPAESIERSLGTKTSHIEISRENDEKEIEKGVIIEEEKEEYETGRSKIAWEEMMMKNNEMKTAAHIKIFEENDEKEARKAIIKEQETEEYQKGRSQIAGEEMKMMTNERKTAHIKISEENDEKEAEKAIIKEEKEGIKVEDQKGRSENAGEEMMRNNEPKFAHIEISEENDEEKEMIIIKKEEEKDRFEIGGEEMMMMMNNKENEKGFRIMQVHKMHSPLVSRFWLMSILVGLMLLLLSHLIVKLHFELHDESSSYDI